MYVCYCSAVTASDVESVVDDGRAESVEAVGDATGAGTGCGGCHPTIEAILEQRGIRCRHAALAVA